jgi:hypothetical protein
MLMVDAPAAAESCSRRHREEWVDGHFGPRLLWAFWAVIILGLPILFPSLPFPLLCSALFVFPDRFSTIAPVEHVKTAQDFCRLSTKKRNKIQAAKKGDR